MKVILVLLLVIVLLGLYSYTPEDVNCDGIVDIYDLTQVAIKMQNK